MIKSVYPSVCQSLNITKIEIKALDESKRLILIEFVYHEALRGKGADEPIKTFIKNCHLSFRTKAFGLLSTVKCKLI